jgi:hypothetical protein
MASSESLPKFKPLNNSNYPEWSGEMKAWLMKLGYWRLVCGKEIRLVNCAQNIEKWETKAEKAAAEIYFAVKNDQRVLFHGFEEDWVTMWHFLGKARLQQKPGACFNAYNDLFSI